MVERNLYVLIADLLRENGSPHSSLSLCRGEGEKQGTNATTF